MDDVENCAFQKVNQEHLKSFEMCWRKMEIILSDRVRIEEVLYIVKWRGISYKN